MRVPLRWLKEYVDISLSAEELAARLTMSGTEVSGILRIGIDWDRVVIGQVESIDRHENADNLFVARVRLGTETITLVTAASNLKTGDVAPVVRAGGRLGGPVLEPRRFRGVLSEGMLCSGDELGVSPDKESIYILEPSAPIGADLREFLGDEVLDIELTPNRPDCLGVVGIAREVAALTGGQLRVPRPSPPAGDVPATEVVRVFVDDPDLCPRYTAAYLEGVRVGPSPPWLQRRLYLAGMRPINNVVDVTNYVMLELGQPLHAFDADLLRNATIRVRRAKKGERLTTIDGTARELLEDVLVIADADAPTAIAGVMGGADSEISDSTTNIVLESATFDRLSVRRTSRDLRLSSEASKRFDKGLDPELPPLASHQAVGLMLELAGGRAATGLVDVRQPARPPRRIRFTPRDVSSLIGQTYSSKEIEEVLRPLGFQLEPSDDGVEATVPSWRMDVEGKADIAEEVARIKGYDAIPSVLPSGNLPAAAENAILRWEEILRSALAAAGLQEVITYALVDPHAEAKLDPDAGDRLLPNLASIPTSNPMSVEHSQLRTSLLPSLFATVGANLRYQQRVSIFEIARVYLPPLDPLPTERRRLAIAMAGQRYPESWSANQAPVDFYDLKATVEAALNTLNLSCRTTPTRKTQWAHSGRAAAVELDPGGVVVGLVGQVHPRVAQRFDVEGVDLYAADLDVDMLLAQAHEERTIRPLPRYPAVDRDLALIVPDQVSYADLAAAIGSAAGPLLDHFRLFDVYRGAPVPEGHRSLAVSLAFRSPDRTLSEDEVVSAMEAIEREVARQFGAKVRGR